MLYALKTKTKLLENHDFFGSQEKQNNLWQSFKNK